MRECNFYVSPIEINLPAGSGRAKLSICLKQQDVYTISNHKARWSGSYMGKAQTTGGKKNPPGIKGKGCNLVGQIRSEG